MQLNSNKNVLVNSKLAVIGDFRRLHLSEEWRKSLSTNLESVYIERSSFRWSCLSGLFKSVDQLEGQRSQNCDVNSTEETRSYGENKMSHSSNVNNKEKPLKLVTHEPDSTSSVSTKFSGNSLLLSVVQERNVDVKNY